MDRGKGVRGHRGWWGVKHRKFDAVGFLRELGVRVRTYALPVVAALACGVIDSGAWGGRQWGMGQ